MGIGDPALAGFLGIGLGNSAGVTLTEGTSLGLSAVWRSVSLISGTIAGLPLKTYRRVGDGGRERVPSFLDSPHPDMSPFEWAELTLAHELLWGNAYLLHVYGGAGQIVGLSPLPPYAVRLSLDDKGEKVFSVTDRKGTPREFSSLDLTHIPALGTDGLRGLSPIAVARDSLGAAMASDKAAGSMFKNRLLLGGILRAKEALTKAQKDQVLDGLRSQAGSDHAGDIAFVPSPVEFTPWTMNAVDAQFLESRHFGVEEVARWFGVPRELLSESGASSWGSGIQELVRAFARFTLSAWTTRLEQRLSMLLPKTQFCEFDYSGLLQASPEEEIRLLLEQLAVGLITMDEARAIRNMKPLTTEPIESETIDA